MKLVQMLPAELDADQSPWEQSQSAVYFIQDTSVQFVVSCEMRLGIADNLTIVGWSSTTRMRFLMLLPPAAQLSPEA